MKMAPLPRGEMPRSPRVGDPTGRGGPIMAPLSRKSQCSTETQTQSTPPSCSALAVLLLARGVRGPSLELS